MEERIRILEALLAALLAEPGHLALERVTHLLSDGTIDVRSPDPVRRWAAALDEMIEDGLWVKSPAKAGA